MNSSQIRKVMKNHVPYFNNVYAIDMLPSSFTLPAIFIVNLDPHTLPGSHWVAIYISNLGYGEYFDSYGMKPLQHRLLYFLRLHTKYWTYNTCRLQGVISNVCGQYCCLYALYRASGQTMSAFTDEFTHANYCLNDRRVIKMFRQYLGPCTPCDQAEKDQLCIPRLDILTRNINII
jgi:hypothetical protein